MIDQSLAFLGIFAILFVAASKLLNFFGGKGYCGNKAILEGNTAVAIRRGALFAGLAIVLVAVFRQPTIADSWIEGVGQNFLWGAGALVGLIISLALNNMFLLKGVNNNEALKNGNISVALVEGGSLLGSSFILASAMQGVGTVWTTVVFYLVGQAAMLAFAWIYEVITPKTDVVKMAEEGNLSAGVLIMGKVIAIALIMATAIQGDFTGWAQDLQSVGLYLAVGMVGLYAIEWLIDLVYLPKVRVDDLLIEQKVAPMVFISAVSIAAALMVTAANPL